MSEAIVSGFITMFVVVDPIGLAPIFLALTAGYSASQRRRIAAKSVVIALFVLLSSALGGEWLLGSLAIGIPAFRIAGGLLLFVIAFEMVFGGLAGQRTRNSSVAAAQSDPAQHIEVFPLAVPLMAGPGAITAAILLAGNVAGDVLGFVLLIAIITIVVVLCGLAFVTAAWFERFLGETGQIVFARILGLVLTALAVQIVLDGLAGAGVIGS